MDKAGVSQPIFAAKRAGSEMKKTDIDSIPRPGRAARLLDRAEGPMLALALVSVALYLGDLRGFWVAVGAGGLYGPAMLAIDLVFLADLLAKAVLLGRPYLKSAWFFIDLASTVPVLGAFGAAPEGVFGLRVLRELRFIRAMRALRMLRAVRALRALSFLRFTEEDTRESRAFGRALYASVTVYAAAFLLCMRWVHARWPAGTADAQAAEFVVVLASALGMGLVLVVCRFQIPDLSMRHVRGLLNLALPRQVAEHFLSHPEAYDRVQCAPATVAFTDIRDFTSTVEGLGSDLYGVKEQLERLLDVVVGVHQKYDLIVDKFIGDCVMSFRGGELVPGEPAEHARRVVRAGLESQRAAALLQDCPFSALKVGGASSADCLIGTFGTSYRLAYTVMGDVVNLAARLEPACKTTGAANLFCENTRHLAGDGAGLLWREVGVLRVPGKAKTAKVFEAFEEDSAADWAWLRGYRQGLEEYSCKNFGKAILHFSEADRLRPGGDGVSRMYCGLCGRLLENPPPEDWAPVIETRKS